MNLPLTEIIALDEFLVFSRPHPVWLFGGGWGGGGGGAGGLGGSPVRERKSFSFSFEPG